MNNWRKNLIQQVVKKCDDNEVMVSKDLVSFLLTLSELNPICRIDENDEGKTENAIRHVTEKLLTQSSPSLATLKMQLYFAKHYASRDETVKKHRLRLHKKTGPLVAEICVTEHLDRDLDVERLYQKVLVVITLLSGLGNPMVASVLREVAVALQSVFQPSELTNYVTLTEQEKEEQLMELVCIVAGIRIFNRDCQRGGEGIDDLPAILQESVGKSRDSVLELLEDLMKTVYRLTSAVEKIINVKTEENNGTQDYGESEEDRKYPQDATSDEDFSWAVELLGACRQQEIYIRKLLGDIEICDNEIKSLMERLQSRLFKLHDTVRYRTAIPTLQVYPQFIDLADIWMRLQDEVIVLSHINNFLWQLQTLCTKNVNVHDHTRLDDLLGGCEILTDAESGRWRVYGFLSQQHQGFRAHKSPGFCAWSFVAGKGSLIPGNPNIGVLKWRGKYFAFSSADAARKFGDDPNRFTYEALNFVRHHYEYVHLFQLYDDIIAMKSREEITEDGCHLKIHRDQGIQTDLHVLPTHIDKDYTHSIWEYRRRALRLATIAQSATRSTQTANSLFRSGVYVQAALPTDRAIQTRRDGQANTMKFKTFIFGLRGRRDTNQHVLTFADDEFAQSSFFSKPFSQSL
ncbi:cilia- and flagella-associated protein 206 isoform X2 [Venturia canescens]|uniref:cilia- and flagella-associated protein 206 isoform X2 n=1 Tax=Venturia canescens TaxID=32260 RepID=UPI001C9D2DD2|nr:cilia- and flagella-associated protein 206-like isoform X2 [Venturia canescens]